MRDLKNKDVWTVVGMLAKIADKSDLEIRKLVTKIQDEDVKDSEKGIDVAVFVLKSAFRYVPEDLQEWLADLCEMSKEEFMEKDMDFTIEVIKELRQKEDVQNFFKKVSSMFKNLQK